MRMLVVDDNTSLARFTARHLERGFPGAIVSVADSCSSAREAAIAQAPNVLIVDRRLPDGDGAKLAAELSRQHACMRTIVTSAALPSSSELHGLLGERGYLLQKPFEVEHLLDLVKRAVGQSARCTTLGDTLPREPVSLDAHQVRNRLAALLAGIRAYSEELRHCARDEDAIHGVVEEYEEVLVSTVRDLRGLIDAAVPPSAEERQ